MRQQATHQSSSVNSLKSSNRTSTSSSSTRHNNSSGTTSSSGNNSGSNHNSSKSTTSGMSSGTKTTSSLKHSQGNSSSSSGNHGNHHSNNNNNGLSAIGHNSSPILPMTPTSSVSPPVNVICKKELGYHGSNVPAISDIMESTSIHDTIKEELGMSHTPSAYSNINARLGQGGNLTPLGSNSSIMTTPSPPITPSQNALSYVPNHDTYFWHSQYNQYNNYNPPASYYSQMDYQNQANYSMGHSGYSGSNFALPTGTSLNSSMSSQAFTPNGIDYMAPQDKYVNMV